MKTLLSKLRALLWPPTKAKLHRLVSLVGYAFTVVAIFEVWAGQLGLTTGGKIGATIGALTAAAASWASLRPKIDATIDGLPIPDTDATPIVQPRNVAIVTQPDTTPTKPAA